MWNFSNLINLFVLLLENATVISTIEGMLGEASSINDDVETILHHSEEEINESLDLLQSNDDATFNNTVLDSNDFDSNTTYIDIGKLAVDAETNDTDIKNNNFEQSNSFNDSLMQNESIENTLNISREITNVTQISTEILIESDVLTLTSEESFTTTITVPKHVKQLDSLLDNEGIEG